jgi:hypothetical protein
MRRSPHDIVLSVWRKLPSTTKSELDGPPRQHTMQTPSAMNGQASHPFSPTKILLGLGLISSAIAWWLIAPPVITFANTAKHAGHFGLVYFHVLGGTIMLFLGLANLYIGLTRRRFTYHKLLGRIYI